jgi:hypothetical protein
VSEELEVLRTVAGRLDAADIPYMLTGSMALNYYAVPRMTRDIDLVVELGPGDADRLVQLFEHDFYVEPEAVRRAIAAQGIFNLIHDAHVIKVDCVVRKDTEYRREEFARRRRVDIAGQPLSIVAPEDLVISKLDWARTRVRGSSWPTSGACWRRSRGSTSPTSRAGRAGSVWLRSTARCAGDRPFPTDPRCTSPDRIRGRGLMTDTSPDVERQYRELLLRRPGEARLRMGCSMHALARTLVRASLLADDPQASAAAIRRGLFLRFYGGDFDAGTRERILVLLDRDPERGRSAASPVAGSPTRSGPSRGTDRACETER